MLVAIRYYLLALRAYIRGFYAMYWRLKWRLFPGAILKINKIVFAVPIYGDGKAARNFYRRMRWKPQMYSITRHGVVRRFALPRELSHEIYVVDWDEILPW